MKREEILSIFYNYIVKEALTGKVDCYMKYNLIFNTKINHDFYSVHYNNEEILVPTLIINNKQEFNDLLVEYVEKALLFYDDSNFMEEIITGDFEDKTIGISKEKVIMTLLWSNATIEDFNNPCSYLRKRIAFFELGELELYKESKIIGYSDLLGTDIECCVQKNQIENETPYSMQLFLRDIELDERIYEFPRIYLGQADNVAYIYAIQNPKQKLIIDDKRRKKLERKMYQVNAGLNVNEESSNYYDVANLKDITPSFLIAANVMVGLLKQLNINKLEIVSILVSRWNAKVITLDYQRKRLSKLYNDDNEIEQHLHDYYDKFLKIQMNLTDKFLRTFRRVAYHHSSVGIISFPMDFDSNMKMVLYNQIDVCNNDLLDETFQITKNNQKIK